MIYVMMVQMHMILTQAEETAAMHIYVARWLPNAFYNINNMYVLKDMHLLQYVALSFPGSESASRIPEFIDDAGQLSCEPL